MPLTPAQRSILKADFATGPLAAQVAPLLQLGPVVSTHYDVLPVTVFDPNPALRTSIDAPANVANQLVPLTINGAIQLFRPYQEIDAATYAALSPADQAKIVVGEVRHAQDGAIAALYSAVGTETITLDAAAKDDVLAAVELAVMGMGNATATVQQKWGALIMPLITLLSGSGDFIKKSKVTALEAAVNDGLLTQAQADAPWIRNCSHAETLFGVGATLSEQDIGDARNSP